MGIKGLQYYMENQCPGAYREVDIAELAERFRRENGIPGGTDLSIAVDGMSCLNKLYGNLCWVLSGQWREFVDELRKFVARFRAIGVRPVFFFDGTTVSAKRDQWVQRRLKSVRDIRRVFDAVRTSGREPDRRLFQLPASMGLLTRFALKLECDCEVYTTVEECDKEASGFARRQRNCLAVLGQDTDYVVYDTAAYLSINALDLTTLKTMMYDRGALVERLGLRHVSQLALVACLCGNDLISEQKLTNFHRWLCRDKGSGAERNFSLRLSRIAGYVRKQPSNETDLERCLPTIAYAAFRDERQATLLGEALRTYSVDEPAQVQRRRQREEDDSGSGSQLILELARKRHVHCENIPSIYSLLRGEDVDSSAALEDDRCTEPIPCAILYKPIRQRTYSVLFGSGVRSSERLTSTTSSPSVREWCVYAGNALKKPDLVTALPLRLPKGTVCPTFEQLWLGSSESLKWDTFLACMDTSFNKDNVKGVAPHMAPFCCLVNYLLQYANIELWEVDSYIAQAVVPLTQEISGDEIGRLDARAVQLATVFMRGVSTLAYALGVCGNPFPMFLAMPWNFFDGKLFHRCYLRAKGGAKIDALCEHSTEAIETFHHLKSVIITGTKFEGK